MVTWHVYYTCQSAKFWFKHVGPMRPPPKSGTCKSFANLLEILEIALVRPGPKTRTIWNLCQNLQLIYNPLCFQHPWIYSIYHTNHNPCAFQGQICRSENLFIPLEEVNIPQCSKLRLLQKRSPGERGLFYLCLLYLSVLIQSICTARKGSACRVEKDLRDNKHNSSHLGQKYAWIFGPVHYLFLVVHSFPQATLSKTVRFSKRIMSADKYPS